MVDNTTDVERICTGVFFLTLNLLAVFGNTLLVIIFILQRTYFLKIPFYEFYYHLIFAVSCINFNQLSVVVPFTILNESSLKDFENSIIYNIFCEADTFGYNLSILLLLALSIDRLLIFILPKYFSPDNKIRIRIFIILSWLTAIAIIITHRVYHIYKKYQPNGNTLYYQIESVEGSVIFKNFTVNISIGTPIMLLISYIACFIKLKFNSYSEATIKSGNWKIEKQILLQGFTISLIYEIESVIFLQGSLFMKLFNIKNPKHFNIVINFFAIIYTGSISASLFIFNNVARQNLIFLFKRLVKGDVKNMVTPMTNHFDKTKTRTKNVNIS